ncbi:sensor histidine kinase [Clostridium oryzae]|uniref:histidine kinase n=1 Tax=Clostridium oryzae TaxID=1450648 RepID=A0A1V4IVD5_9CLOT|nr:sensor histidine kinase [Clostridium oryzae]OPJ63377.1 sensor histidine kinase YehU [Clostridium oryzae]
MKKFHFRNIYDNFIQSSIRTKLMISYFVLIFVPLIILTFVAYSNISVDYEKQLKYSAKQSFDQARRFIAYKTQSLIDASDIIYYDSDIQRILSRNRNTYENDIIQQNIDMRYLESFLYGFKNSQDIYRVSIYVPNWFIYSNQNLYFENYNSLIGSEVYKKLMNSNEKVTWTPPEKIKSNSDYSQREEVISLLRKIRNRDKIGEYIGVVKISIMKKNIDDIINKANITRNGVVYIQDSNGNIICCSNVDILNKYSLRANIEKKLANREVNWDSIKIHSKRFAVDAKTIDNTDWTIVTAIPYSEILSEGNKLGKLMIFLVLIIGGIAYYISYKISGFTLKRLSLLTKSMKKIQNGNLDVKIKSRNHDEIGELMNSFNYMVKRVNMLVEEQYKNGKEIKNAELKALQAQINPHFLYNTLDLINWEAIDNNVPKIADIAQKLAKFYKLSLNKGQDIVTIEDEINHVATYVQIQNLRFDNRIDFSVDIAEELYEYKVLKIILQPIVENSIIHGIMEDNRKGAGTIHLSVRKDENNIVFRIKDNGIGMTKEKIDKLLSDSNEYKGSGYGIKNINNRIKLCYGQEYGLQYESTLGEGVLVRITIPAMK